MMSQLAFFRVLFWICFLHFVSCQEEFMCEIRPLGTKTASLIPDNRFSLFVEGIVDDKYLAGKKYTVRLFSNDIKSTFIAFTIYLVGGELANEKNPRMPTKLNAGRMWIEPESPGKINPKCNNTIIQSDISPKTQVEVKWLAPPKGNDCVKINAVVAIRPDVWFSADGPLTRKVCEDTRKADDMPPMQNEHCQICEDARYQVTFQGLWSYNTHPTMFPNTSLGGQGIARFSDLVGASHNKMFNVFRQNSEATLGLQMLAEQGNTTTLELEIMKGLIDRERRSVRTIIKATGQPKPNLSTSAMFRASANHHFVSLVTGIIPSPDWFLGVSNMELCNIETNDWSERVVLNLYPLDAGTDSGKTFESPNESTSPPQHISTASITSIIPKEQIKPFGRLQFDLIRKYTSHGCPDNTLNSNFNSDGDENQESGKEFDGKEIVLTTPEPDPLSDDDCPMTTWRYDDECQGVCDNGTINGYRMKFRDHIVNGVVVTYDAIPPECMEYPTVTSEDCKISCGQSEEALPTE